MGGTGLVMPLALPVRKFRDIAPPGIEPSILPLTNRIPALLFLVRYDSTSTLSYSEMGLGIFARPPCRRLGFYCTHLWVDSDESIEAGEQLWGLHKRRAAFDWQRRNSAWSVTVSATDGALIMARFEAPRTGFSLPVSLRCFSMGEEGKVIRWSVRSRSAMARTRIEANAPDGGVLESVVRRRMFGMYLEPLDLSFSVPG